MAFEDLLRVQAYVRGDGRNPMAEAITRIGKRKEDLADREQRREDVFESQRRSQEFQEKLVDKQADAYMTRWKAMQEGKLQGAYPKKPNETDEQWEERVGKAQAEPVNRLLEDSADASKRASEILKEQAKRKQGEVIKHSRKDAGFLSMVEALDANTARAIRGGKPPEAAIAGLAERSKDKAAKALAAYEETLSKYAGTDDRGNPILPEQTVQAIDEYNKLINAAKMASEQADRLITKVYENHGDFKGAPYLKSIARELLGPRAGTVAPPSADPLNFAPRKSPGRSSGGRPLPSMGGLPGAGATPATGPGASSSPPPQSGAPYSFPGRGVVPAFLNEALPWARENVLPPIEAGAAEALRRAGVAGRNIRTTAAAPYRFLFSGDPIRYEGVEDTEETIHQPLPVPPLPMQDAELGGALRAPVRSGPLTANVTIDELRAFMADELGMDPSQIQQHEEEKASGNPEAAQSEQELLSEIMRRRAMALPQFHLDPSAPPLPRNTPAPYVGPQYERR